MTAVHMRFAYYNTAACGAKSTALTDDAMAVTCKACLRTVEFRRHTICMVPVTHPASVLRRRR